MQGSFIHLREETKVASIDVLTKRVTISLKSNPNLPKITPMLLQTYVGRVPQKLEARD